MTREEAINVLDKALYSSERVREAANVAIEALKEEPKSKVIAQINVDADEVVKLIEQNCNWKQPKGHWILKHVETAPKYIIEKFYCSECGEGQVYGMPSYCPNCGADMRPKLVGKHADVTIIDEACMKGADNDKI